MRNWFAKVAQQSARVMGHPFAFLGALVGIFIWGMAGKFFRYSDTWQLVINTSTTIVTFLMVFLIQATQNRDNRALQIKLDELLHAIADADSNLRGIEHRSEEELTQVETEDK